MGSFQMPLPHWFLLLFQAEWDAPSLVFPFYSVHGTRIKWWLPWDESFMYVSDLALSVKCLKPDLRPSNFSINSFEWIFDLLVHSSGKGKAIETRREWFKNYRSHSAWRWVVQVGGRSFLHRDIQGLRLLPWGVVGLKLGAQPLQSSSWQDRMKTRRRWWLKAQARKWQTSLLTFLWSEVSHMVLSKCKEDEM